MEMSNVRDLIHVEMLSQKYSREVATKALFQSESLGTLGISLSDSELVKTAREEFRLEVARQKQRILSEMAISQMQEVQHVRKQSKKSR